MCASSFYLLNIQRTRALFLMCSSFRMEMKGTRADPKDIVQRARACLLWNRAFWMDSSFLTCNPGQSDFHMELGLGEMPMVDNCTLCPLASFVILASLATLAAHSVANQIRVFWCRQVHGSCPSYRTARAHLLVHASLTSVRWLSLLWSRKGIITRHHAST